MKRPIFYFQRLERSDIWTVIIYILLTTYLFYVNDLNQKVIFYYTFGTQLGLYIFYYKALRNLSFYFIWIAIGLFHLLLFYLIKEDASLSMSIKQTAVHLRNTLPLILLYQGLRLLSLFVQSQELVSPQPSSFRNSYDKRKVDLIDYLLFFTYLSVLIALTLK